MHKGVQKSWMYLVPLALLGLVATCDSDFTIKNPFSKDKGEINTPEPADTVIAAEVDTVNVPAYEVEDTVEIEEEKAAVKKWRIVIGSVAEKSQADQLASETGAGGEILYVEYLDTYRVVHTSYSDLSQAQEAFPEIQQRFPQAWLVYY